MAADDTLGPHPLASRRLDDDDLEEREQILAQYDWSGEKCLDCSGPPAAQFYHVFCSERCAGFTMKHFADFSRLAPFGM